MTELFPGWDCGQPELFLCWDCKERKHRSYFVAVKGQNRPYSYCRKCVAQRAKSRRKSKIDRPATKECVSCLKIKDAVEFRIMACWDGLTRECKDCLSNPHKKYKGCPQCGKRKETTAFHKNRTRLDGLDQQCNECDQKTRHIRYIKLKYGVTWEWYEAKLAEQGGVCAICKNPETANQLGKNPRLSIDHDHKTGKNRGLLCYRCNHFIGYLERLGDDALEKYFKYLKYYSEK